MLYIFLGSVLLGSGGKLLVMPRFKLSAVTGIAKSCILPRINIFLSTLFCI